ncbi:CubicO group peptidase, beta-lactamase class C family [Paenibacillus algorifonticola]|uniref:CubicO group peptidase, beta-lactamase class C family n=1 Tax=Paenibacillus algorifonticola TaxID=684063 RepID=A0A1I2F364_9BACL|nr:serine hydrolase domain-containing protein [Paenibacillus algorifonticola]SFE99864.1 CubicO group peptidase, beta-lactamase class C family [Paenibacillus algorifonticola]
MSLNINIVERMEHYRVAGLSAAFIQHGQLSTAESFGVLEQGASNQVNSDTIFNACSISKFLTSMLAMKLVEDSLLDLDEDVNDRLISWKVSDHPWSAGSKVTLRALLSHQAGIVDPEGSFGELQSKARISSMAELLEGETSYCKVPIRVEYEPGSDFQYSDAGFCIIQQLIEDVLGKSFEIVMSELIFEPLHMKNSTYSPLSSETMSERVCCGHDKHGNVVEGKYPMYPYPAAAGLWTTPSDLAILVVELMNALKDQSKIGLSASYAKELITPQGVKEWTGLGLFLDHSKQELEISSLGWGVGFQCMLVAFPYSGTGAVIMTNTDLGVHQLKGIIGEIISPS